MDSPFLSVYNTRVEFTTNKQISIELTEDIGLKHSLDKSFTWHFLSIVWTTNGSVKITFDFVTVIETTIPAVPPSDVFVFVDLGQSFYGYMSQVSVWKTALTSEEHFDILLLGWTQYSFDSSVKITRSSTAARSLSICDIQNTIAKMGLNSPACKHIKFTDKTPPEVNYCEESILITADYSQHQYNSSDLRYTFLDDTDGTVPIIESQLFSYGASDIAVSSTDSAGNIGVCMTRAYVTPNQCIDTEPSFAAKCSDNMDGRKVTCPPGMLPSVPTPNFVSCSKLLTYNLDNMYEKPDRIVCGGEFFYVKLILQLNIGSVFIASSSFISL
ncbi:unnamed protein product [Candidula unifasciata]|uniref:HYR domain-containing protein n=1 Tax=Candidula unifasciata TaxID=100452 RepID=A0A8S3YHV3_9EUPU|nr:unnamed protein product [Candidula unifasciata]